MYENGYLPFGKDNGAPRGSLKNSQAEKFTGKSFSQATGLYYYYQRWYDSSIGWFISPDPIAGDMSNPQNLNAYTYASDSPTTITDPSGLSGMYVSAPADPCRASKDFWAHFACSFTNPQAIILAMVTSPEGAPIAGASWGLERVAPYLPEIVSGGLTLGAFSLLGYELLAGEPSQLKLPDISWWNSNGRKVSRTGITGPTITGPPTGLGSKFGMMGQSTLVGTRIAVDKPILDPYRPGNSSVPPRSTRARLACTGAILIGLGLGIYADVESSQLDLELPAEGALWAGAECAGLLLMIHLWT